MRVLVFGATGRTGREVVRLAAQSGWSVTAFARTLGPPSVPAAWIRGDVLDADATAAAVGGHDAVISVIGNAIGARKGDRTVAIGTRHIVDAMQRARVSRLLAVSAFGVGESLGQASWLFRLIVATRLQDVYRDKAIQEQVIRASRLDWLIARPARLVASDARRRWRRIEGRGRLYERISTCELARFLVDQLTAPTLHRTAIALGSEPAE